jgi:hypothetical protein
VPWGKEVVNVTRSPKETGDSLMAMEDVRGGFAADTGAAISSARNIEERILRIIFTPN